MAAPQAPVPLKRQFDNTRTIVVTVPLAVLDKNLVVNGATAPVYNAGGTVVATYTIPIGVGPRAVEEILDLVDRLNRETTATVS